MVLTIILFVVGLILIIKGGDFFVDAASWMAEMTGIPKFVIGATVVSLATTLPELIVSVIAVRNGSVGMGIGNAVGSVICNMGVILAISLILMPAVIKRREIAEKGGLMALSAAALLILCFSGTLSRAESFILYALLVIFIFLNTRSMKNSVSEEAVKREKPDKKTVIVQIVKFVLGAVGIVLGANLLVNSGSDMARAAGVPESVIGLTFVAFGTSLPELVTTITAIRKKEPALSVGNILGANVIDLTLILSTCAVMSPSGLPVEVQTINIDMPVCLMIMAVLLLPALITGKLRRWQGFAMMGIYAAYCIVIF